MIAEGVELPSFKLFGEHVDRTGGRMSSKFSPIHRPISGMKNWDLNVQLFSINSWAEKTFPLIAINLAQCLPRLHCELLESFLSGNLIANGSSKGSENLANRWKGFSIANIAEFLKCTTFSYFRRLSMTFPLRKGFLQKCFLHQWRWMHAFNGWVLTKPDTSVQTPENCLTPFGVIMNENRNASMMQLHIHQHVIWKAIFCLAQKTLGTTEGPI